MDSIKPLSIVAICLVLFLSQEGFINAQESAATFDTLKLQHAEYYSYEYSLQDTLIHSISIQTAAAVQMKDVNFKTGGNILGGMMTIVTGIGFGSTKDVDWYLASAIRTSNPKLDWIFDVYCPGYVEKERTRVKNDDGSYSVETNYVNRFSWQAGSLGFIIETGDTIGWNYVYRNPRTDTAVQKWSQLVYNGTQDPSAPFYNEFALLGEFTGKKCCMLYNSADNRIYIFNGSELSGIYHCPKPPQMKLSKKKRKPLEQPYLLVDAKLTAGERLDVLRLAMVALRMKIAVESYKS